MFVPQKECCDVNCFFQTRATEEPSTTAESFSSWDDAGWKTLAPFEYYHQLSSLSKKDCCRCLKIGFWKWFLLLLSLSLTTRIPHFLQRTCDVLQTLPHFTCCSGWCRQHCSSKVWSGTGWQPCASPSALPPLSRKLSLSHNCYWRYLAWAVQPCGNRLTLRDGLYFFFFFLFFFIPVSCISWHPLFTPNNIAIEIVNFFLDESKRLTVAGSFRACVNRFCWFGRVL